MDYYRVLNVPRSASAKEIKAAYFRLAKALHPDVTGNDAQKAERFKHVSEAHAVLSDAARRREYDASRPLQEFGPRSTAGEREHPYARHGAPDLRARRMYGIDEEVWLAHHYGVEALRRGAQMPPRYYGMNVVEERLEREEERIRRRQKHYQLHSTAGYFLRREARMRKQAEEEAAREAEEEQERRRQGLPPKKDEDGCVIS